MDGLAYVADMPTVGLPAFRSSLPVSWFRPRHVLLAAGVLLLIVAAARAGQAVQRSITEGVYSAEQAKRGRVTFDAECTNCHDTGKFTDPKFMEHFAGQPLKSLFDTVKTMPEDNPGSLRAQEYADILSFFLELNGFPAGADDLKGTDEVMTAVRMEARKPGPGPTGRSVPAILGPTHRRN